MAAANCFAIVPQPEYFIGLDLGQARDHTAIAVLERSEVVSHRNFANYGWMTDTRRAFRHLERFPLNIEYPDMVDRVQSLSPNPTCTSPPETAARS